MALSGNALQDNSVSYVRAATGNGQGEEWGGGEDYWSLTCFRLIVAIPESASQATQAHSFISGSRSLRDLSINITTWQSCCIPGNRTCEHDILYNYQRIKRSTSEFREPLTEDFPFINLHANYANSNTSRLHPKFMPVFRPQRY